MICADCGASIIGGIPSSLLIARRCPECYKIYSGEQELKEEEKKEEQKKMNKEKKKEKDEKINNRFDILDL